MLLVFSVKKSVKVLRVLSTKTWLVLISVTITKSTSLVNTPLKLAVRKTLLTSSTTFNVADGLSDSMRRKPHRQKSVLRGAFFLPPLISHPYFQNVVIGMFL